MRQNRNKILFVTTTISVIALVFVGGLLSPQSNFQKPKSVLVKQLSIQTLVCACIISPTAAPFYVWSFSLTNEGRMPITAIVATLNASAATFVGQDSHGPRNSTYTLNQFLIQGELEPPATNFVRNPPLPFVGPTNPLLTNQTASNGEVMFQPPPYLLIGEMFPVTIGVTYSNGTISDAAISAQVVAVP